MKTAEEYLLDPNDLGIISLSEAQDQEYLKVIKAIQQDARQSAAKEAAEVKVKSYPSHIQGFVMESGFDYGCYEKKKAILAHFAKEKEL